ncbi:MAG: glycosyltransferase family 39 protein [Candidatus Moranbacteria bacterium]|nr:glycosyltransferase family 39 protein [Candidatus Moranbacteria bacterium]
MSLAKIILEKAKKIPAHFWILAGIILIGIFLRTWHFQDWLIFNPDQARDIGIVSDVLKGKSSWIITGPEAGNTRVGLGPWFYHLEILAAKIFGNAPDKLAYPDLFFSILTIPLFYIFLKKYFPKNLSLALAALYAVSYFAVKYSRFAWNPNSIPFFVLLFLLGMLMMAENGRKRKYWGAVMAGIGIGVGIQLHVLLFFVLPTVAFLALFYLFIARHPLVPLAKMAGLMIIFFLLANIGQIAYESKHNFGSIKKFVKVSLKTAKDDESSGGFSKNIFFQAQANFYVLTSLGEVKSGDFETVYNAFRRDPYFFYAPENKFYLAYLAIGSIFTLAGYILLVYFWRREREESKKNFLGLVGIYSFVTIAAMTPIVTEAELRYYIVLFFLPYIFLGLMLKPFWQVEKKWKIAFALLICASVAALNLRSDAAEAKEHLSQKANSTKNAYFGETGEMAKYMMEKAGGSKVMYLQGSSNYFTRYYKPLGYFLKKEGYRLNRLPEEGWNPESNGPLFDVVRTNVARYRIGSQIRENKVKDMKVFGDVTLILAGR